MFFFSKSIYYTNFLLKTQVSLLKFLWRFHFTVLQQCDIEWEVVMLCAMRQLPWIHFCQGSQFSCKIFVALILWNDLSKVPEIFPLPEYITNFVCSVVFFKRRCQLKFELWVWMSFLYHFPILCRVDHKYFPLNSVLL